jgi:hypothetical protein
MRIRIKGFNGSEDHSGLFGGNGEIPIGTEIDLAEAPAGWAGRYDVISGGPAQGSTFVTGEPGPLDRSIPELEKHLEGVTDADEVQRLIDAETAGKSRSGALAVLEARRDALLA